MEISDLIQEIRELAGGKILISVDDNGYHIRKITNATHTLFGHYDVRYYANIIESDKELESALKKAKEVLST